MPVTLTYRNPAMLAANPQGRLWVENFTDKYGRLARAEGPFDYIIIRNPSATAEVTVELNQDPGRVVVLRPGDAFADSVQPYTSLRVTADADIAADTLIVMPKRTGGKGSTDVGN